MPLDPNDTPQTAQALVSAASELVARWKAAAPRLYRASPEDFNAVHDQLTVVVHAAIDLAVKHTADATARLLKEQADALERSRR